MLDCISYTLQVVSQVALFFVQNIFLCNGLVNLGLPVRLFNFVYCNFFTAGFDSTDTIGIMCNLFQLQLFLVDMFCLQHHPIQKLPAHSFY